VRRARLTMIAETPVRPPQPAMMTVRATTERNEVLWPATLGQNKADHVRSEPAGHGAGDCQCMRTNQAGTFVYVVVKNDAAAVRQKVWRRVVGAHQFEGLSAIESGMEGDEGGGVGNRRPAAYLQRPQGTIRGRGGKAGITGQDISGGEGLFRRPVDDELITGTVASRMLPFSG